MPPAAAAGSGWTAAARTGPGTAPSDAGDAALWGGGRGGVPRAGQVCDGSGSGG